MGNDRHSVSAFVTATGVSRSVGFFLAPELEDTKYHVKCILVDRKVMLIGSANFTRSSMRKNVELGVRVSSPAAARAVALIHEELADEGLILPLEE